MSYYLFEAVEHSQKYPAKIFMTTIDHSQFHWHYEYELILVMEGSLLVTTTPKQVVLEAGDIILLNSKMVHELHRTNEGNLCLFIQMNQLLFSDFANDNRSYFFYLNSKSEELLPKKPFEEFVQIAASLGLESIRRDMIGYYRIKGMLYRLIADLFEYVSYDIYQGISEERDKECIEQLMHIFEFVQNNYKKDSIFEDLYKSIGMSEKAAYRFLKANIGMSVKDLVTEKRIETSKAMLKFSDKSIGYIADECGFGSENTFYRVFKKEVGITPNEYRTNGTVLERNTEIKGYLDFNRTAAIRLLEKYSLTEYRKGERYR
ncbi:MAG: AraC family transcriptional regulator [Mobilitalea sp.]